MTVLTCVAFGVLLGPVVAHLAARTAGSPTVRWTRICLVVSWIAAGSGVLITKAHILVAPAAWWWAVPLGVGLAVIDVDCHRLPTPWLATMAVGGAALFAEGAAAHGQWVVLARAVATSLAAFIAVFALQLMSRAGLGFGDTKLCGVIGFYCGTVGLPTVVSALVAGLVLNGLVAACLVAVFGWKTNSRFAAGPGLLSGVLVALMFA